MSHFAIFLASTQMMLVMLGCESGDGETEPGQQADAVGAAAIAVDSSALSAADIARVVVTVSGDGISPDIVALLTESPEDQWSGTIADIPAGTDRTFVAEAFDSSDTLIYSGTVSGVTILDGGVTAVTILIQQVDPLNPFANAVPVITAFVTPLSWWIPVGTWR